MREIPRTIFETALDVLPFSNNKICRGACAEHHVSTAGCAPSLLTPVSRTLRDGLGGALPIGVIRESHPRYRVEPAGI